MSVSCGTGVPRGPDQPEVLYGIDFPVPELVALKFVAVLTWKRAIIAWLSSVV